MIIIYGLGNNDDKYINTRHNAGRMFVEFVAKDLGLTFSTRDSYYYSITTIGDEKICLLYSKGFMNESGAPLMQLIKYFNISREELTLIIAQDDSDQLVENQKLAVFGGSAGHHGINSIYKHILKLDLQPEQIWRLKIGIRPIGNRLKSETFVLKTISTEEVVSIAKLAELLVKNINLLTSKNWPKLQTIINGFSSQS